MTIVLRAATLSKRDSKAFVLTSFYQQYNNVVLTSSLQRRFINNITTLLGLLLIDVVFTTLVQRHGLVEQRCDIKATVIQRRYVVVCLLGQ